MKLLAGNSNLPLARAIADYLETPLTDASVRRFADEEVFVEIHENVRGEDVFVIQSTGSPANDNLMTVAGADRVLSMDLHAGQIQGFFDIPTDNLYAAPVMSADIQARFAGKNLMVVSPDVGGVVRARALAKR